MPQKQEQKTDFPKLALYIAGGYLLYLLTKKIASGITDPFGTDQATEDLQNQIAVDESKLTYPKWQYSTWAEALETAMLSDLDEDEEAVDAIIWQIQNDDDWAQLVKAYGVRKDWYFGVLPGWAYSLPGSISWFLPERVTDYNNHFAGWNMRSRI